MPTRLALLSGLVPLGLVHLCHAISAGTGRLPWCLPYLEGCVSFSAAARYPPANHLFDLVMVPMAGVTAAYWWLLGERLAGTGSAGMPRWPFRVAAFLILPAMVTYALSLGQETPPSPALRRLGINSVIGITVLMQWWITFRLLRQAPAANPIGSRVPQLRLLCLGEVLVGSMSAVEDLLGWHNNAIDNIIEWNFLALMFLWIVLAGVAPRR